MRPIAEQPLAVHGKMSIHNIQYMHFFSFRIYHKNIIKNKYASAHAAFRNADTSRRRPVVFVSLFLFLFFIFFRYC